MMYKTLTLWKLGILLLSLVGAYELNHFPENFVVAKMNDLKPVTLTCKADVDVDVTWKLSGDVIEKDQYMENYQQDGPNLNVLDVEHPMLGEYSCWSGEKLLSSTYLLLEAEEERDLDSLITCWAKSYDCTFNCNWISKKYTAVRLGLGNDCSERRKSCQWVIGSEQANGVIPFELSHSLSSYAEETTMLVVTIEAINSETILRRTKRFYLRDIIKPDTPQIVRCQKVGEHQLNVSIDPPSSWSSPHSFFTLEHEIEYEMKNNGQLERSVSALIPKKISKLRVRSRDPLVLSSWSQWTPWKNVTY
uniref:Fibronectin type-III domain-containing protein n=1 Tax=Echeneis naucrates TaxID=173247 RepID=A0A665WN73_ECHNA